MQPVESISDIHKVMNRPHIYPIYNTGLQELADIEASKFIPCETSYVHLQDCVFVQCLCFWDYCVQNVVDF